MAEVEEKTAPRKKLSDNVPVFKFIKQCFECNSIYNRENPPVLISCGHSICLRCKNANLNKKFSCCRCFSNITSLHESFLNKSLLEQVEAVTENKSLLDYFEKRNVEIDEDPLVKVINMFQERVDRFEYLIKLVHDVLESFKDEDALREIVKNYSEVVREFNVNVKRNKVSTSLRKMADAIEPFESELDEILDIESLREKVRDVRKRFFEKFKLINVDFSYKRVCKLQEEGFYVYSRIVYDNCVYYAELQQLDFGLHFLSFRKEEPDSGGFVFEQSDFLSARNCSPKYVFFDLETKIDGASRVRRIYILLSSTFDAINLTSLAMGEQGVGYRGATMTKKGRYLVADCQVHLVNPALTYPFPFLDDGRSSIKEAVGIVTSVPTENNTVLFQICLSVDKVEEEKEIPFVIGIVESGQDFLNRVGEKCSITECGAYFVEEESKPCKLPLMVI